MPTDILSLLIEERTKIDRAIAALQGTSRSATPRSTETPPVETAPTTNHTRKRRRWTPAMRRAAAARSKAMWAKKRKAEAKKG
jgi:hypothetical protein